MSLVTKVTEVKTKVTELNNNIKQTLNTMGVDTTDINLSNINTSINNNLVKKQGTAIVSDVIEGKTFINESGELLTGTYTSPDLSTLTSATAVAGDIMSGKTAYVNGSSITGSMVNRGAVTGDITTQNGTYTIPAGYHNGSGKVTGTVANLIASNIKKGVTIGGITGTY